jgi:hypothetical protein
MGGDLSKEVMCCDCGFQQRNQILESTEVNGVSSMKLHENNQRFLRAMAEGGKSDLILGLFSTTREFDVNAVDDTGYAFICIYIYIYIYICMYVCMPTRVGPV